VVAAEPSLNSAANCKEAAQGSLVVRLPTERRRGLTLTSGVGLCTLWLFTDAVRG